MAAIIITAAAAIRIYTPRRWSAVTSDPSLVQCSKRKDLALRSGRSPDWVKSKNLACEAVRREAEENWGRESRTHYAQRASEAQG